MYRRRPFDIRLAVVAASIVAACCSTGAAEVYQVDRGTVTVLQLSERTQLMQWIGPGVRSARWPTLDPDKDTIVELRGVPNGLTVVEKVLGQVKNVAGLILYGVCITDADLAKLPTRCPNLRVLMLCSSASLLPDELGDLTDDERRVLESSSVTEEGLTALKSLQSLELLEITGYPVARKLLTCIGQMQQLSVIMLCDVPVTDADLEHLAGLTKLTHVSLNGTQVTGSGLKHLHACTRLGSLQLARTQADDSLARHFQDHPWSRLESLLVSQCRLTSAGVDALSEAVPFSVVRADAGEFGRVLPAVEADPQTLRELRSAYQVLQIVGHAEFGVEKRHPFGVALTVRPSMYFDWMMTETSFIDGLLELRCAGCPVTGNSLRDFNALGRMDQLTKLDLQATAVDDAAMREVAKCKKLQLLILNATDVGDEGVAELAPLHELQRLSLNDCPITDRSLEIIARLPKLRIVELENCRITDEGLLHLLKSKRIETIELQGTDTTPEGRSRLQRELDAIRAGSPTDAA